MNRKERLLRTFRHEPVDRLPTQINYTAAMGARMTAHFGVPAADLPAFLDNHLLRVDLSFETKYSQDGSVVFDWWGAGHDTGEEGYYIRISPLANSRDLDAFAWPDPDAPGLFEQARRTIEIYGDEYFIVPNLGFALFERAWSLRGLEQFLMDLALDPGWTGELLDRITEIQLALIQKYIKFGVDGAYFGDDYGAQKSLILSPASWRALIKPRLARLFAPFRERGLPILMHSDGQIQKILPDLVEIGLTVLNPVQPEVLEHAWLHQNFGDQLAFYGGISTQTTLPQGTPEQVRQAVRGCIQDLAPQGTGLLLAPSHRMMTDIPLENVETMLAAFQELA